MTLLPSTKRYVQSLAITPIMDEPTSSAPPLNPSSSSGKENQLSDFSSLAFLATAFLAGAFLAATFFAGAFLAGAFLVATFFAGAFLAGAFLAATFFAAAFFLGAALVDFFPVVLAKRNAVTSRSFLRLR